MSICGSHQLESCSSLCIVLGFHWSQWNCGRFYFVFEDQSSDFMQRRDGDITCSNSISIYRCFTIPLSYLLIYIIRNNILSFMRNPVITICCPCCTMSRESSNQNYHFSLSSILVLSHPVFIRISFILYIYTLDRSYDYHMIII